MLQIRKIREFIPKGQEEPAKYDAPLDPDIVFPDIKSLLSSIDEEIKRIPEKERYNLFCTLWNQDSDKEKRKKKTWGRQELLLFDIDGIPQDRNDKLDQQYLDALSEAIKVSPDKILQIYSGHGYHFVIQLANPIEDVKFFNENRIYYQVLCSRINDRLRELGLIGEADADVFAPNRLLRLPNSMNKKKDKPETWVKLLNQDIAPVEFDIKKASGMPVVNDKDYLNEKEMSYIKTDTDTVESECEFLKWAKANQHEVNEGQWYAMLSIVARLDKGKEKIHEYSRRHPGYNEAQTDRKAEQSLRASGPRTCDNIDSMWGGCSSCPHYKKARSPITIKGKDFIATAHSGFHAYASNGRLVPQYDDLRKFYEKETPYKNVSKQHYRYMNNYWNELDDVYIDNFAQEQFHPPAKNTLRNEFRGLIKCTNLDMPDWFNYSTNRKINLTNGVLDIDTMKLEAHSEKYGFRNILSFGWDENATCPTFEKMLDNVTCGRESLKNTLLEYMGYCLSNDDPRADKILVLTGEGQNGKSRFLNILKALGAEGAKALGIRDLTNAFHLQQLDGALFNIIEEVPSFTEKDIWELIKGLVTGASVTVSRKFKDPYSFQNKAKFIMTCNELPKGANPNHGFFRRLLIVPFEAKFSHEAGNIDVNIDQRIIENELPGVLNMVLKAYHRLKDKEYQFSTSKEADAALSEYKADMDSVARFIEDTLEVGEQPKGTQGPDWALKDAAGNPCVDMEELFESYAKRCDKLKERPVTFRTFTKRVYAVLNAVPFDESKVDRVAHNRVRIDGVRKKVLYGVTWYDESKW